MEATEIKWGWEYDTTNSAHLTDINSNISRIELDIRHFLNHALKQSSCPDVSHTYGYLQEGQEMGWTSS